MLKLFEHNTLNVNDIGEEQTAVEVKKLNLWFGNKHVLNDISMRIPKNKITALIGQSGCGKSTLISCFNRLNDLYDGCKYDGEIIIDGQNINSRKVNVSRLRTNVGMVFQRPNPFPMSIYENVCYGLKLQGVKIRRHLDDAVESALKQAALWDEVKDRLFESAHVLSGGQQQRLVIARALALKPDILLLDEPTSALDPLTTLFIEELMDALKKQCTIIIVTHNMQQAARVSDYTAFFHQGRLIEYADSDTLFTMPEKKQTEDYITGRYG
ncbi:phosphate ABC transporter ATP-binding protein PstB [Alteromonas sp. DY56-G5]|jgi:phosphate transport system ATP-binding protein|uniref:Phosphate transporter ATP-binding protein n=1 Tax=Alteromonas macleodii (strain English Channel 673) TaxID=1004788 RepID=A0AB32ZV80_ALTME|nr:phosphate ABC transporter ATP-binding protein PstB [Alteromonas macleodii]MEC7529520.1 phosphate ABC transporter ATP-binding protein PstB [Pseudomonadota bacterium]NKX21187.1 phosphate ABC transporter ATP-binding protein [Alteromonadaceae bacterium A_SAG2]AFT73479.1 phosphate transporter ATP-binding protein [Alteromonas macleodii str. 'English Channel 673']MBL3809020.1 phosphate ABC transporter ATP-binding protein [Alteromonas macleodii]MBL3882557.1 phosphate ABC transporter ATP-binding pro|tara:strand:- start:456 stop:1262 length:807 start_codon:yes stop_codon:yes gene_type:complete